LGVAVFDGTTVELAEGQSRDEAGARVGCLREEEKEVGIFPWRWLLQRIRVASPSAWQRTWADDQRKCHTVWRRGHRVETGSVAGTGRTGYYVARLKRGIGPLACAPSPILILFQYLKSMQTSKCNFNTFCWSKNTQTLHVAISEYFEYLSQLGQLQIPKTIHVINH
jgi:hypothetical protein